MANVTIAGAGTPFKRPIYGTTDLRDALQYHWRGYHLSEKMDGVFAVREFSNSTVLGEAMRDGRFFPFDVSRAFGQDVSRLAWRERQAALDQIFSVLNPKLNWHRCATGAGAEFIETILACGGEGGVAKPFDAPLGRDWFKVKRSETFDCRVEAKLKDAVLLSLDGSPAGKCALFAENYRAVNVGDVIEIEAFRRYTSGKFREPRFLRVRPDKNPCSISVQSVAEKMSA